MKATTAALIALFAFPFSSLTAQKLAIENAQFRLNGKPFRILSGEMHYARIPEAYWKDRMLKAKAMGLNAICTYVFWNVHEPSPGKFNFKGNLDIARFIRTAQEVGLYVLLRPGPYVCSEWDFGGLPSWLLKDPELKIRCLYPTYWNAAKQYLLRLGTELKGLTIDHGGPIIAVQVENEYGSYGNDKEYMREVEKTLRASGFDCLFYTSDGANQMMLEAGTLESTLPAVNFSSNPQGEFKTLAAFRDNIPPMNGEFWSGWFTQWGNQHWGGQDLEQQKKDVQWMLETGKSINFYMFHGGTNFGFMAGANKGRDGYTADVTSYDYGAPLTEDGRPTPAFFAFRDLLSRFQPEGVILPDLPPPMNAIDIPPVRFTQSASLFQNLPKPVFSVQPRPMEAYGQDFGYILYRTKLLPGQNGRLRVTELHDYAQIYLDGVLIGSMDRRLGRDTLSLPGSNRKERTLDILVEALGRVNFGSEMIDRKGITERVTLGWQTLMNWNVYLLPMQNADVSKLNYKASANVPAPAFFKATFALDQVGDTFLDLRTWHKGVVWVNGHNLGRYWQAAGPQHDLYLPGSWMNKGENEIIVFDLELSNPATMRGDARRRSD